MVETASAKQPPCNTYRDATHASSNHHRDRPDHVHAHFRDDRRGQQIQNFSAVAELMENQGVPLPTVMLADAILFLLAGSHSIIVG
ncbi:MAG: hypothetical protein AAFU85_20270 [Planctomycetota bacterium]